MTIPFPNLPNSGIRKPGTYVDTLSTPSNGNGPRNPLLIGQVLTGSPWATTGKAGYPQLVVSLADVKANAGAGSMLALMVAEYQEIDDTSQIFVLPLADDPGAVAGTQMVAFTGPATAAGVLALYVAGTPLNVPVTQGMTAAQLATAVAAEVALLPDLPCTAAVDGTITSQVDFTAKGKGLAAADIDLRMNYIGPSNGEVTPSGIGVTITAGVAGATNPSLTTPLANLGDEEYDWVLQPYTDTASLTAMKNFMAARWAWNAMIYGHAFAAYRGTYSQIVTFTSALNDAHLSVLPFYDSPSPAYVWAAGEMARDVVSVLADPGVQVEGPLTGVLAPPVASRFPGFPNRNALLYDGSSTFRVAKDGTVSIEKLITTYQTNAQGQPDTTYLNVETMYLVMAILRAFKASRAQFAGKKLMPNLQKPPAGSNLVTFSMVQASDIATYQALENQGYVQDTAAFAKGLQEIQNAENVNRIDALLPIIVVNQINIQALLAVISTTP